MKKSKKNGVGKTILQAVFGLLTGFVWLTTVVLICYTVISGVLPFVLVGTVGSISITFENLIDTIVFGGGITICVAGLTTILLWKFICWSLLMAKKFYKSLCHQWSIGDEQQGDSVVAKSDKKPISKKRAVIIMVAVAAALILLTWGVPKLMDSSDVSVSGDTDVTIDSIMGNDSQEESPEDSTTSLTTVADAGLLDDANAINFSEWTEAEFDPVLDNIERVVKLVQNASTYSASAKIGFDVEGDMVSYGEELLTYIGIDITASDVVNLVSDISQSNGVFYDIAFAHEEDSNGTLWSEADAVRGTNVVFDGEYLYVSGLNDIVDGSEGYEYVAKKVPEGADLESMSKYELPAELVYSLMQPALVNYSVDTDNVSVYTKETEYGTSYMYRMTETLSRSDFECVTKMVMLDCVGDGEYTMTIVYTLEDGSESGLLVVSVDTDITDVVITVPADEQVYFGLEE